MELSGRWKKEDGFIEFFPSEILRYYEVITEQYHQKINLLLESVPDEEIAAVKAAEVGYRMVTDYKVINNEEQFATTYISPVWEMDLWYETDPVSRKRDYNKGFIQIRKKS